MPETATSSRVLDVSIRRRMPYPVAYAWHRIGLAVSPASRLERVLQAVPTLLRTVVLFQLPDYLRGPADEAVDGLLPSLARPSDGQWLQLARNLGKAIGARPSPPPFMPEATEWLLNARGKPTPAMQALEEFIRLRNALRHTSAPSIEAEELARLEEARGLAHAALETTQWLAGYRPFRVVDQQPTETPHTFRGRIQLWVGSQDLIEPEPAEWRAWLVSGRVYLTDPAGARFLQLHPFFQVLPDPTGRRELLHVLLDAPRMKRLRLAHESSPAPVECGAEGDAGEVPLADWLAVRPRETVVENPYAPGAFADPSVAAASSVGPLLAGRYEVRGTLGEGGMAVVYRVWDQAFEQEVALKVLRTELCADPSFRERFRREARLMARIRHPSVLSSIDVGELQDGQLYLKMRLAAGGSLRDFASEKPPDELLRRWTRQALEALAALHAAGVIHRDVKPSNLLLDEAGDLLLADFGIAFDAHDRRLTQTLERLGSPAYMAPEQATHRPITDRADIYALAVVLHELSTGALPTDRPGDGLSGPWGAFLRRLGAPEPEDRPSAAEALVALEAPVNIEIAAAAAEVPATAATGSPLGKPAGRSADTPRQPPSPREPTSAETESIAGSAEPPLDWPELTDAGAEERTRSSRPSRWPRSLLLGGAALAVAGAVWAAIGRLGPNPDAPSPPATVTRPAPVPSEAVGADGMALVDFPASSHGLGLSPAELTRHRQACEATGSERCERANYFDFEAPEVSVQLSPFYLDRNEVSRRQYEACVAAGGCAPVDESGCLIFGDHEWETGRQLPAPSLRPDAPRTCVGRAEAESYCRWAGRQLPSEAQWEHAAAGSAGRVFPWGDNFDPARANNDAQLPPALEIPAERPSGATPEGVLELAGNAYEWVADDACAYTALPAGVDPVCRAPGGDGIVRGGSFLSDAASLRTSFRRRMEVTSHADNVGFRCARAASAGPDP